MDALSESLRLRDESFRIRTMSKEDSAEISLERFRARVARWNKVVGDNPPGPLFKGVVTKNNITLAAKSSAEILHIVMQRQHADSDSSININEATAIFDDALAMLRMAARNQDRYLVARAFEALIGPAADAAVATFGVLDKSTSPDSALEAVCAFHLIHRICSVAAAIPAIQFRQMENRGGASLSRVSKRRNSLRMPGLPMEYPIAERISDVPAGERIAIIAWAKSATWIDRPKRPYTELKLDNGEQLRVHYKNTRRIGIIGDQWIWARCKVEEPEGGIHYAVAEFEGPTTSAGDCWESWLQVEARDYYDISPGSIHLFSTNNRNQLDLYSRLSTEKETTQ